MVVEGILIRSDRQVARGIQCNVDEPRGAATGGFFMRRVFRYFSAWFRLPAGLRTTSIPRVRRSSYVAFSGMLLRPLKVSVARASTNSPFAPGVLFLYFSSSSHPRPSDAGNRVCRRCPGVTALFVLFILFPSLAILCGWRQFSRLPIPPLPRCFLYSFSGLRFSVFGFLLWYVSGGFAPSLG